MIIFKSVNIAIDDVKMSDIQKNFPLEGEYIFRFKGKVANNNVWLDIKQDAKIPLHNGKIIMKATRISWESNVQTLKSPSNTSQKIQTLGSPIPEKMQELLPKMVLFL